MPRKTTTASGSCPWNIAASMRPRPDAAENVEVLRTGVEREVLQ